jgi:hypothetical protein
VSSGYGFTQEMAKAMGAPVCPRCGRYADGMSEHFYFALDVTAARCTRCRNYTIVGADRWVRMPNPLWARIPLIGRRLLDRWRLAQAGKVNAMAEMVSRRRKAENDDK